MTLTIRAGQLWQHHSTGVFEVYRIAADGRIVVRRLGEAKEYPVREPYLRRNFTPFPDPAPPTENT